MARPREPRLNAQALARKDEGLMSCLVSEPGYVTVSADMCFPIDTEVLTPEGFVKLSDLAPGQKVWQVNKETLVGSFVEPSRIIRQEWGGRMITYKTVRGSLEVTEGHTMLWVGQVNHPRRDKALRRVVTKAGDGCEKTGLHFALHSHYPPTATDVTPKELWMACMWHADGSLVKGERHVYRIEVARPEKRAKVRELLGRAGIERAAREGQNLNTETWNYIHDINPLLMGKEFNTEILDTIDPDLFVEALQFWDGTKAVTHNERTDRFTWGSVRESEVDKVQAYLVRHGYEAQKTSMVNARYHSGSYYTLSIRKQGVLRINVGASPRTIAGRTIKNTSIITHTPHTPIMVGCVTVPEGFILVRQNGKCFVSGNCAGEPTITCHFSQDPMYRYACFDGVGKTPYYNNDGVLMLDDIYLMTMSVSPIGKDIMLQAFYHDTYDEGRSFVEQWLVDPEVVKKKLKRQRFLHKILCLGPDAMVRVRKKGFVPIEQVSPGDYVWDGESWVQTSGPVQTGYKTCMDFNGQWMTPDHQILQHGQWVEAQHGDTGVSENNPSSSWAEVWAMVCAIVRDKLR